MNILITGAAGFVGSHLAERLEEEGHTVVGVDDFTTGSRDNWPGPLVTCDIADRKQFYQVANHVRPSLIVHCAASYSDPNLWHRDIDTNATGSVNVAIAARHHGARVIYMQTALPPISSYAISKIAGEHYLTVSGVPLVVFRLANVYGPRNLSGPIPTFYKRLTAGEGCTVVNTRRDMVYIDDLTRAVLVAVADPAVAGRFDLCSGRDYTIRQLYDAVAETVGVDCDPNSQEAAADDVASMDLDPHRARTVLGWEPSVSLADGVAEAVSWYAARGVTATYTHLTVKG